MAQLVDPFPRRDDADADAGDGPSAEEATGKGAAAQALLPPPSSVSASVSASASAAAPPSFVSPVASSRGGAAAAADSAAAALGPSGAAAVPREVTMTTTTTTSATTAGTSTRVPVPAAAKSELERKMELLEARFVSPPPALASPAAKVKKGGAAHHHHRVNAATTGVGGFGSSGTPQRQQQQSAEHDHHSHQSSSHHSHHSNHSHLSHSHHSFAFDAPSESSRDALLLLGGAGTGTTTTGTTSATGTTKGAPSNANADSAAAPPLLLPPQNAPLIQTKSYREANLAAERHMARIGRTLNAPVPMNTAHGSCAARGGGGGSDGNSNASSSLGSTGPGDNAQHQHNDNHLLCCTSNSVPASLSGDHHHPNNSRSCSVGSSSNQTLRTGHHAGGKAGRDDDMASPQVRQAPLQQQGVTPPTVATVVVPVTAEEAPESFEDDKFSSRGREEQHRRPGRQHDAGSAVKRLRMSENDGAVNNGGPQQQQQQQNSTTTTTATTSSSSSSGKRKSTPVKRALPSVGDASHQISGGGRIKQTGSSGGGGGGPDHGRSSSPTPSSSRANSGQSGAARKRGRLHFSSSASSASTPTSSSTSGQSGPPGNHNDGGGGGTHQPARKEQQQQQSSSSGAAAAPAAVGLSSPFRVEPSSLSRERSNPGPGGSSSSSRGQNKLKVPPPNNTSIHDFFGRSVKKAGGTTKAGSSRSGGSALDGTGTGIARPGSGQQQQQQPAGGSAATAGSEGPPGEGATAAPRRSAKSSTAAASVFPHSPPVPSSSAAAAIVERLRQRVDDLERSLSDKDEQLKAVSNNQTMMQASLRSSLVRRESEVENLRKEMESRAEATSVTIERLVRENSAREAVDLRQKLASDGARLGRIVYTRAGMHTVESWEDGNASRALKSRRAELKGRREELERRQKAARKAAKKVASTAATGGGDGQVAAGKDAPSDIVGGVLVQDGLDAMEAEESVRLHLTMLKKEEEQHTEEEEVLFAEKGAHIRALKRVASEDSSRFKSRQKLHDRYVPLCQLGKGGFSEVWRAYDLVELKEVAVKIHQLDPRWSDAKKENYTKHVSREYEIHRDVRHPRIVSLYDVFEIDTNSFATVLECCEGTDLDALLKEKKTLPERDARAILLQILSGMRYLSTPSADGERQGIIHYDLKPGNILFDKYGDAKITDFGLSKIVDTEDPADSMELTSQGAGTYWYLPPECFVMHESVRISNKVDVWSIGVIYYQMLYGRRPFGDGQSQDKVLSNNIMLNAREVAFPAKPHVSDEAKNFLRQCLAYDQAFRPNISQICTNPYLQQKKL